MVSFFIQCGKFLNLNSIEPKFYILSHFFWDKNAMTQTFYIHYSPLPQAYNPNIDYSDTLIRVNAT